MASTQQHWYFTKNENFIPRHSCAVCYNVNVDIHLVTADYIRLAEICSCLTFKRVLKGIS